MSTDCWLTTNLSYYVHRASFKINYPIHLVSLSVPTYSVTIKIKENYLLKYNFIATEIAKTSLLKHFILSHDIAQSKHIWRHIINLFSSKNKHLETGNQDTLLVPPCGNISHPLCLLLSLFSPYSKHHATTKKSLLCDYTNTMLAVNAIFMTCNLAHRWVCIKWQFFKLSDHIKSSLQSQRPGWSSILV